MTITGIPVTFRQSEQPANLCVRLQWDAAHRPNPSASAARAVVVEQPTISNIGLEFCMPEEIRHLTGRTRAAEQAAWLRERCIPHRRDGRRVIVSRIHVRAWLEGHSRPASRGINWAALNA